MASSQYYKSMDDLMLKPRLLNSLIRDRLPDEKHPFQSHSDLAYIVSSIKTHHLLSEPSPGRADDLRLVESWKSAVDAWVECLLSLVSSKMPDKCWAGICLLGVTCEECSSDRFLASYSVWFQKLLSKIQPSSDFSNVKVASCASLSDLFTRLAHFPNVKKDGISQAGKLIQPVLKLLSEDGSEAVWEGTVDLLCTILAFFPSSVHRHYDNAESIIVSKIMSGKCTASTSKKFAKSLALLPKARGDEDSWSLAMFKILISVNTNLKDAFQGLEEDKRSDEIFRLLVPPGKDPPPPLGGQAAKWNEQLLMPRVSTLMQCCCMMLSYHYTVQVTVPVLAFIRRILDVDGSPSRGQFITLMQQEFICSELPGLHLCSLDLLLAVIEHSSQLLSHAAEVVRLLKVQFRRCALPSKKLKVYLITRTLLIRMGVGITRDLAPDVIGMAFTDLSFVSHGGGVVSSVTHLSEVRSEALQHPTLGKTSISVQIAALEALKALVTVGGASISEDLRSNVDCCLITVTKNACDGRWFNEARSKIVSEGRAPNQADFQLTALSALLASLLCSTRVKRPYLSEGLALFRTGRREAGSKIAEFCAHALMAMEVLIHPRALPLLDSPSGNSSTVDEGFNRSFLDSFLGNGEETRPHSADLPHKQIENANERCKKDAMPLLEGAKVAKLSRDVWAGRMVPIEETPGPTVTVDVEMGGNNMDESEPLEVTVSGGHTGTSAPMSSSEAVLCNNETTSAKDIETSDNLAEAKRSSFTSTGVSPDSSKGKGLIWQSDSDSLDSLPDIIDGDPDDD